jgi:pyrroline-5-carboxylate reductase
MNKLEFINLKLPPQNIQTAISVLFFSSIISVLKAGVSLKYISTWFDLKLVYRFDPNTNFRT